MNCVSDALKADYRSIDTAQSYYFNETESDEDMSVIAALDKKESSFFSHYDPATVEWFVKTAEERKA